MDEELVARLRYDVITAAIRCVAAERTDTDHADYASHVEYRDDMLDEAVRKLANALTTDNPETMPVFVLKAKDKLALETVSFYEGLCRNHGLDGQAEQVAHAGQEMLNWRSAHPDQVKYPDHTHRPVRVRQPMRVRDFELGPLTPVDQTTYPAAPVDYGYPLSGRPVRDNPQA